MLALITTAGQAVEGQSYTLTCVVSGDEMLAPTNRRFQWDRVGGMEDVSQVATLTFNPLRPSDAGEYMCTVRFDSQILMRTQTLNNTRRVAVLGLVRNIQVTPTATTLTITWTVSGDIAQFEVTYNYTINGCLETGGPLTDTISDGSMRSHTLRGLNEDSKYTITIRAINTAGSITMATITADASSISGIVANIVYPGHERAIFIHSS